MLTLEYIPPEPDNHCGGPKAVGLEYIVNVSRDDDGYCGGVYSPRACETLGIVAWSLLLYILTRIA